MKTPYELDDFIYGRVERLCGATKTPKILVLWQHGNEELGPRFGYYMSTERPDLLAHVDYLCGNPLAAAYDQRKGYTSADLNRSYNHDTAPGNYEQQRAQEILAIIKKGAYDYVLDLHTTVTHVGRLLIIQHDTPFIRGMIARSGVTRVLVITPELGMTTLVGHVPQALAIEYSHTLAATPQAARDIAAFIDSLLSNDPPKRLVREFYYMDAFIPKAEDPGKDARNFVLCKDGYYPVLFGEGTHSYRNDPTKKYLGFAARRKEDVLL